jgi:methionyl-tRNA formyltransferase
MKELKIVFMGTPVFSVPVLEALIENYNVVGIVTQPDRLNNDNESYYSPVKKVALKYNIKLFQPENIRDNFDNITELKPSIIITCAYGQILPKKLLDYPPLGCINVHASLLPKLRGGAPIHRAIIKGYSKTGITIMYMSERLDAGRIISQTETPISDSDNVGSLHDRLSIIGRDLLIKTLPDIITGNINPVKQEEEDATFASNITREDERIDYSKTKKEVFNRIRGLNPWPGAYSFLEGKIFKIWSSRIGEDGHFDKLDGEIIRLYDDGIGVKVANGEVIITEIQLEGKNRMNVQDYLNGLQNKDALIGKVFE